ncbi:unnamed protein product [Dibothriocephalus latus]|uniref:Uncharacterized protein n=1 Tax=Dibothriocephalus latus TaxID=60516 RepID=A0A3P7QXN5_DIBLA|nr:unnamed protein product [Dibothriocephalus latus]
MPGGYARAAPRQAERTSIKSAGASAPTRSSVRSAGPVEAEERKSGPQQEKKEKKKKKKKKEEAAE